MVTSPNAASAASNARAMAARSVTSASIATARPPAALMRSTEVLRRSTRRATNATAAPFAASTSAKRAPRPLEAPVTSAARPSSLNRSAAFMGSSRPSDIFLSAIKRPRQKGRKPRHEPQNEQGHELNQYERNDPDIDMRGGDLRRRNAAQIEQGRAQRRMQVGGLQVERHHDPEPHRIDTRHLEQGGRDDRHHHEDDLERVHHKAE